MQACMYACMHVHMRMYLCLYAYYSSRLLCIISARGLRDFGFSGKELVRGDFFSEFRVYG